MWHAAFVLSAAKCYGLRHFAFFGICRPFSVDSPAKTERVWLFQSANQRKERTIADICNHYHCTDRADQLTKHLATVYLAPVGAMPFIPGVMELRYVLNDGAAFSMLADAEWGRVFLIVVTGLALAALAVYFFWKKPSSWLERWVFILIFSGGLGNDRPVLNGYVVDSSYHIHEFRCIQCGGLLCVRRRRVVCHRRAASGAERQKGAEGRDG